MGLGGGGRQVGRQAGGWVGRQTGQQTGAWCRLVLSACPPVCICHLTVHPDVHYQHHQHSLWHRFMPHVEAALAEFFRVLKPGGRLIMSVYQGIEAQPFYPFAQRLAEGKAGAPRST